MENTIWELIEPHLMGVARPGRYAGNEVHAIRKEWQKVPVRVALAFPDVYEIGMSHLGLQILYHVLNKQDWILAERVFSPWVDMERVFREEDAPLFSLESRSELRRFDVVGISLQYELQYTNVLNLLDLGKIPLRARDRGERDPLVIAGGPCAYNPEPLAEFLDAAVLGDGEEVVLEIADAVREAKRDKGSREETLQRLAGIEGVYVPSFYAPASGNAVRVSPSNDAAPESIRARTVDTLAPENYPAKPVVPLIEITHDRFSMELMRGCTRGCRFCNAGMIYRPVRERPVDELTTHARDVIAQTGYDELSLVSLSTSDYRSLSLLLHRLNREFQDKGVSVSFPSLRADTFTEEIADTAVGLRRSGLTLAPEAGTQRLRDVINKNHREEDLLRAVEIAYERGWRQVKLYFMIGLPTETEEDVKGIADLVGKVVRLGKRYGKKEVHVSISPFTPKAHTPFQWEAQDSLETLEEKIGWLKRDLRWPEVKLKWRDPRVSRLEAVLGRGGRELGSVVFKVWRQGGRFDAWSDQFDFSLWRAAFDEDGLSMDAYASERDADVPLPWDHLSKGVSRSFLLQERERALKGIVTEDCRRSSCRGCGMMEHPACREIIHGNRESVQEAENKASMSYGRGERRAHPEAVHRHVCIGYRKGEKVRFTSHLDTVRAFLRAMRRANIPLVMSQGYHAHPRVSTGPPLPLGYTSRAEYMTMTVRDRVPPELERLLNRYLPEGFEVFGHRLVSEKGFSLNGQVNTAVYRVRGDGLTEEDIQTSIRKFMSRNSYRVTRIRKGQEKEIDIRPFVIRLSLSDGTIQMELRLSQDGTARVDEVLGALQSPLRETLRILYVERTGLYIEEKGRRRTPLEHS